MSLRILLFNDRTEALAARLAAVASDVEIAECNDYAALPAMLSDFHPDVIYAVRFAGTPGFPRDALMGRYRPRWIANGGVGTDHLGSWDPNRTIVTNAAGVAADMMAEYVLGGFLYFTLDIPGLNADKAKRRWQARSVTPLAGKTLLIAGLGSTGQALASRAKAFGMRVIGTRARARQMENVELSLPPEALRDVLPQADAVAIATPLTPATRGMIGLAEFSLMKEGVLFADVSRGGVVDQSALAMALKSGRIKGAAVDVFETEPLPQDSPLWDMPNLIISPHCSSVYDGWEEASFDMFLDNLSRFRAGKEMLNVVDPKRGY